jgi:hypothetical protein
MKYQVQISYTNPSHEHVTLRRRVETVTRLVEASTEGEALNRAANQQRALGFRIQEAKVLQPLQPISLKEEVEQMDEVNRNKTKTDDHGGRYLAGLKLDKMKAMKEEAEQVDEANMRFDPEAAATPKSRDVQNFRMKDTNRRAGALSKKYVRRMTKLGGLGPNQTKKDTEAHMKANFGEEFGADKRDAGYKMSPAVRKAQGESDRLSKVVKPVQAGTLAAQRRRAEMKKEAVEPGETRVVNKAVKTSKKATKAAEKMVSAAKGKLNKINVKPTMDLTGQEKTHSKA